MSKRQRIILIIAAILTLGALIFAAIVTWNTVVPPSNGVNVNVQALPNDSHITLDGKTINAGKTFLATGTHTFKATRQYFTDATQIVHTQDLKNNQNIYLMPSPDSEQAKQYLIDHPDIQRQREAVGGVIETQKAKQFSGDNPIVTQLPHNTIDYTISYSVDDKNNLSFNITLNPYAKPDDPVHYKQQYDDFKQEALDWLKSNNVDVTRYPITYDPPTDTPPAQ